ncbi:MAG: ATP-binding protein, partial [Pseudomonadota bacterium]
MLKRSRRDNLTQSDKNQGISYRAVWLLVAFFALLWGTSTYLLIRLYNTTSVAWVLLALSLIGGLGLVVVCAIRSFRVQTRMNKELQESKKLLESRVQERTSELESTNQEMLSHILKRKQVQKALYQHSQILSSITDTILIISKEKKIIYANSTACEMYGDGSPESLIGKSCHDSLRGFVEACVDCVVDKAMSFGKTHKVVTTWRGRDGKEIWVYNSAFPYYDDEGGLVGAIMLSTDYTAQKEIENELKKAKQEAEAASEAKSDFLARMSHEIRTPMYGILGTLELVLDGELKPEQRDMLLTSKFSAEALQGILNDILDFSKIEARKIDLESRIFSPTSVVESVLGTMAIKAQEKGLELISDIKPDVPAALVGDPYRLRQILLNLLGNAVKFTEKGEIVISALRRNYSGKKLFMEFIVSDTGIGIRPEKLGTIFDPFAQAEGFISRTFGGTGLGLAICGTLTEIMGGKIWVESEAGKGSTFHFSIPFGLTEEIQPLEDVFCSDSHDVPALVVDDNPTNRRILVENLTRWGFCVEEAEDAEKAIEKITIADSANRSYGLMLIDYQLPGMSGAEL